MPVMILFSPKKASAGGDVSWTIPRCGVLIMANWEESQGRARACWRDEISVEMLSLGNDSVFLQKSWRVV